MDQAGRIGCTILSLALPKAPMILWPVECPEGPWALSPPGWPIAGLLARLLPSAGVTCKHLQLK